MKPSLALILIVFFSACGNVVAPAPLGIEDRAVRMSAPPEFKQWWIDLEACSGRQGDFGAIDWYVLPDTHDFTVNGTSFWGYWEKSGNRIFLASAWADDKKLVMHEEMHALLQDSTHPAHFFNDVCGPLTYPQEH